MLLALNRLARRQRRRVALVTCIVALGAAVVLAHGPIGLDHMGSVFTTCVAVLQGVALGATAVALALLPARRPRPSAAAAHVTGLSTLS